MPLVNGHQAETGCYVEGHWGQYGPDHLADQAEAFGWEWSDRNDPRWWRMIADALDEGIVPNGCPPGMDVAGAWDRHIEAADKIEQWLNDHTPQLCPNCETPVEWHPTGWFSHVASLPGPCGIRLMDHALTHYWAWEDGEFFLTEQEEDDE